MNIYNFIYCFFYKVWSKRGDNGNISGAGHLLFAIMMHLLLLSEIIRWVADVNILPLPNYGTTGRNRNVWMLFIFPFWIGLCFFYNKIRTQRLMEQYKLKYGNSKWKNTIRVLLYVLLPMILTIVLSLIRQKRGL